MQEIQGAAMRASGGAAALLLFAVVLTGCAGTAARSAAATPASAEVAAADPQAHKVLSNSCFDCHSDRGALSWNARLAPSYLFAAGKAREALNFSAWQSYGAARRQVELADIAKAVRSGSMPPGDYEFFHPAARLDSEQKQALLQWVSAQEAIKPTEQ